MHTLIRPTLHRSADFRDKVSPDLIISSEEAAEMADALKDDPNASDLVKQVISRQVPMDPITARWLMGPGDYPEKKEFTYDPIEAKYNHFLRMVAGEISTVEYDTIRARIDEETAA